MKKRNNFLRITVTVLALYSITISYLHFVDNPTCLPDKGHRYFGVQNQKAAVDLAGIFREEAGLRERMTFSPTPSNQMLLTDNTTVLGWLDQPTNLLPSNAISLPVDDPMTSAVRTVAKLKSEGYEALIVPEIMAGVKGKLVMVTTNAFDNAMIVYRKNITEMGSIPHQRMLTK
ncbi:MAG: hypothetical protein WCG55_03820 [bacterium]